MRMRGTVVWVLLCAMIVACSASKDDGMTETSSSEAVFDSYAPTTHAVARFDGAFPIHGVAGDRAVVFAVQPTATADSQQGVHVTRRNGEHLGRLPAPPDGWGTPLSPHVTRFTTHVNGPIGFDGSGLETSGELILSDVRVPPAVAITHPTPAEIYRYEYAYEGGAFHATHLETWVLPANMSPPTSLPTGILYMGSLTVLRDGSIVITDTF